MYYSILDTDLYKFTVSYAYMKLFPNAECTFTFKDRNKVKRTPEFLEHFKNVLKTYCNNAKLTIQELNWLLTAHKVDFIAQYYWEWLYSFRFEYDRIKVYLDKDGVLCMEVTDKCYKCTLYEIPCMFLIPEVNNEDKPINWERTIDKLAVKVALANKEGMLFSEFGTRRRFNYEVQNRVCSYLKQHSHTCVGTSNVHFAMKYDMKPIGTHPHEWFMFHGAQFGYKNANYMALENWVNVYDGDLGIALSDTYTSDVFFSNFSLKQAKLFDGVRQDSGDEYEFIDKTINFYKSKGIDPLTKTIVFSNSLNFPKAVEIKKFCVGKIKCSFGIGTDLTCDVYGNYYDALGKQLKYDSENIVMKMSKCRMNINQPWFECIKISDDLGKHMGNNKEFEHACYELNIIN
ncbi:nicotinate phosphoribosyltransferase [bacterium]|nr:nicotinate phosphoribosyltransferase [bacterium]